MAEKRIHKNMARVRDSHSNVIIDTSAVFPNNQKEISEMNMAELYLFSANTHALNSGLGVSHNLHFTKGIVDEVTGFANLVKYLRRKEPEKNYGRRVAFKHLVREIILARRKMNKRRVKGLDEDLYGKVLSLVDDIAARVGEAAPEYDIRKEDSNTDEEIIASAYTMALQRGEDVAVVTADNGIREVGNTLREVVTSPLLNDDNYNLVDLLIHDSPVHFFARVGDYDFLKCWDSGRNYGDYHTALMEKIDREKVAELNVSIPGREEAFKLEFDEEDVRKFRSIHGLDSGEGLSYSAGAAS